MITKLFIDTNIMMDLLGERIPHYDAAAKIATLADKGKVKIIVSAFSYPTIYYLLGKFENPEKVKEKLRKFKIISEISELSTDALATPREDINSSRSPQASSLGLFLETVSPLSNRVLPSSPVFVTIDM